MTGIEAIGVFASCRDGANVQAQHACLEDPDTQEELSVLEGPHVESKARYSWPLLLCMLIGGYLWRVRLRTSTDMTPEAHKPVVYAIVLLPSPTPHLPFTHVHKLAPVRPPWGRRCVSTDTPCMCVPLSTSCEGCPLLACAAMIVSHPSDDALHSAPRLQAVSPIKPPA